MIDTYTGGANTAEGVFGWRSEVVKDLVQLVDVTGFMLACQSTRYVLSCLLATFEDGFSRKQFSQDATNRPDINGRPLKMQFIFSR